MAPPNCRPGSVAQALAPAPSGGTSSGSRVNATRPGIPREERERIFERFYRVDPNGTKPGMGLGLSIVRGLVESCGGTVWVEDAPGGGAAFRVSLRTSVLDQHPEVVHA